MVNLKELQTSRQETEKELIDMLKENQRVCVVRPCSWGKSYLITKLCNTFSGKKIIVEPTNLLKDYLDKFQDMLDENVYVVTYQKLLHKTKSQLKNMFGNDIKYIFLDEVHRVGAKKWNRAIQLLTDTFFNAKVIGMSATPTRTDGNDVVETFFNNIQVTPMYLGEAITRGILPNVTYVSALYTVTEEYSKALEKINKLNNIGEEHRSLLINELDKSLLKYNELHNIPNILQKYLFLNTKHLHNMKFVLFCNSITEIDYVKNLVKIWFQDCYKGTGIEKEIALYDVHYKKGKKRNLLEVKKFEEKHTDKIIDILISVNMFNEGYHLDSLNGIIMLRKTKSTIIYFQQIGRAISQNSQCPIIFDFVNNYNSVENGYVSLFTDERWEYDKDRGNIFNKETKEIFKLASGEIINIHDETKDFIKIIDSIFVKREMNTFYGKLEKCKSWIELYHNIFTTSEIVARTKVPKEIVSQFLIENNIKTVDLDNTNKKQFSKKQKQYIIHHGIKSNTRTLAKLLNKDIVATENVLHEIRLDLFSKNYLTQPLDVLSRTCLFANKNDFYVFCEKNKIDLSIVMLRTKKNICANTKRTLSLSDIRYIKNNYKELTIEEISKKIKKDCFVVAKFCKENYLDYKTTSREFERNTSEKGYEKILEKIKNIPNYENMSLSEIGHILNLPTFAPYNRLCIMAKNNLFNFDKKRDLTDSDKKAIEANINESIDDITDVLGKDRAQICNYIEEVRKAFIFQNSKLSENEIALKFGMTLKEFKKWEKLHQQLDK